MTQTLEPTDAVRSDGNGPSPQQRADAWLAQFETALAARDAETAAGLFAVDSFWRDLVAFTWNIKTVEGRDQIAAMLTERLGDTAPSGFVTTDPATGDDAAAGDMPAEGTSSTTICC